MRLRVGPLRCCVHEREEAHPKRRAVPEQVGSARDITGMPTVQVLVQYLSVWWLRGREQLQAEVRPSFDSMALLVTWTLWKERNARVFRRRASAAPAMGKEMLMEAELWCDAGFRSLAAFAMIWSQIV